MKAIILTSAVLLALGSSEAIAQACSQTNGLKQAAIRNALGDKWACAKDGSDVSNEQIARSFSGTFKECHSGLTTGVDPIDNHKGTFTMTNNPGNTPDTITYNYGTGDSYTYNVYGTSSPYTFCRVSDGKIYTVYITTCPPPTLNQCP